MKSEKYIVLLRDQNQQTMKSVEKEFQLKLTSSEFLSSENKSFDIIDDKNGVLYKNLNVMVADQMDEEQLVKAMKDEANPIVYFEKERIFHVDTALDLVKDLQKDMATIQQKLVELEKNLNVKKPSSPKSKLEYEWGLLEINLDHSQLTGKGELYLVL